MSLRDFLLDYAERAPKAERVDNSEMVRFRARGGCCCPLELAADISAGAYRYAYERYRLDDDEGDVIVRSADWEGQSFLSGSSERVWRAVLEKLAEPETTK